MIGKRQFSLQFMFFELFWVASALGLLRASFIVWQSPRLEGPILFMGAIVAIGAAIGGLFGKMIAGATWTTAAVVIVALLAVCDSPGLSDTGGAVDYAAVAGA